MAAKKKKHPIDFEYCECGCKCYSAGSKGIGYSIYWDLSDKPGGFKLWQGHGRYGVAIGNGFDSLKQAEKAAQKHFDAIP
jgi:hypothetical protein